ncbi:transcription corepressor [Porites harrisoni]
MLPGPRHSFHLVRVLRRPTMLESDISTRYHGQRRNYLREASMPDSPTDPASHPPQGPPVSSPNANPASVPVVADVRTLSNNSTSPAVNGVHSSSTGPVSPSSIGNSVTQLPPACGARQLSKLKRFLTTLQQFGSDISPEIGERVRGLVMNLVNSTISIEEFHAQLQEATNFPLRPFVIPFLKANLPLLQRELLQCAQMAKQTPPQYLRQHEDILSERDSAPLDPEEMNPLEINENGKRKASDGMRPKENGAPPDLAMQMMAELGKPIPKRPHLSSNSGLNKPSQLRMEDITMPQGSSRDAESSMPDVLLDNKHEIADDWRHVDTMLQCIIGMVDKTKRAVSVLQTRCNQDREELLAWARKTAEETEAEVKRRAGELMAKTLQQTEERVAEVKRRAEEAVSDVKRQAVVELQKAVRAAEEKANEAVASAHGKMEKAVLEARRQATEDTLAMSNHQSDSSESCWNCGRKATETCSGCNLARYCGPFCQHKDWENHHHVCGQQAQGANEDTAQGGGSQNTNSPKESAGSSSSPAVTRMTTPTSSADPISSLSDYVMKTPST